jgi:hypothetical protein
MIKSNRIIEICEEWIKTVSGHGGRIDVFVNPSSSDYLEIYKGSKYQIIKFIADNKNKKVYVWNADTGIHRDVLSELGLMSQLQKYNPDILVGDGVLSNGKAKIRDSGINATRVDWSWIGKYIRI